MKTRSKSDSDDQRQLAVLIDADNAQPAVIAGLLAEVAKYGVASVKRIYGDFTSQRLQGWKSALLDRFDGVCLVSSDSDFTRLAQRLREEGLKVYGFGERKTPDAFVQACDKFVYTEVLRPKPASAKPGPAKAPPPAPAQAAATASAPPAAKSGGRPAAKAAARSAGKNAGKGAQPQTGGPAKAAAVGDVAAPARVASLSEQTALDVPAHEPAAPLPPPRDLLEQAIDECSDEQGWAHLGAVGNYLNKLRPDFDSRLYGHKKLSDLLRRHPQWFEVQERGEGTAKTVFVRIKS
jgi:pyruvate/2-oxoglutarate dehydrogenase complex dihydrolipoamide acyltransferase (E2) component